MKHKIEIFSAGCATCKDAIENVRKLAGPEHEVHVHDMHQHDVASHATQGIWYLEEEMRRGIHISFSLVAVLLLLKPFDCFSSGPFTRKAADCCKKGKCVPSTNADDCCKATLPGGKHLLASKAPHHSTPTLDLITTNVPGPIEPVFGTTALTDVYPPTGSPPRSHLNLPLLI